MATPPSAVARTFVWGASAVDSPTRTSRQHHPDTAGADLHAGRTARIPLGVLDDIGEDPLHAPRVEHHRGCIAGSDLDGQLGIGLAEHHADEFDEVDPVEVERRGSRLEPGDLEEVDDQTAERPDLGVEGIDRRAGRAGQLVTATVEDRYRHGQRRERPPDVMADVRREPSFTTGGSSRSSTIVLNDRVSGARSGSSVAARRTPVSPDEIRSAAREASLSGWSTRLLIKAPALAPTAAAIRVPTHTALRRFLSVRSRSRSDSMAKKSALLSAIGTPMSSSGPSGPATIWRAA